MMKDSSSEAMKSDVNAVAIWEAKFKKDTLVGRDFREYWKLHVPTIYAPDESTNFLHITYDDDNAQKLLFDTLKQFICIDNPAEVLKHLKELTTPAALCGKVFRMGEATYSCRDCGQDGTCVLCRDCFKASAHQQHRYKMNQSVGGGYCDCGDREAWKDSFCCSIHERNAAGGGTNSLLKFPPEIVQRARAVFSAEGFKDAAEKFSLESGVASGVDLASLDDRIKIRDAIREGRISDATDVVNKLHPELLDADRYLYFHLQQQHLIELIRAGRVEEALSFAQQSLAERGEENTEVLAELERTLALLAFDDPANCPFGDLLNTSHRQKVASELNAAILRLESSADPTTRLETLLKLLLWAQGQLDQKKVRYPRMTDLASGALDD